jgi:tetratricopeptide (TPR) repeat protein
LQRAVTLDPDYALAWSELSLSYVRLSNLYDADPVRDVEAARAAVQRALALNPADAAAHYLLATIKVVYDHDWNGAVAEMDAARRADPNLTTPPELVFVSGCNSGPCHEKFIRDISRDLDRDPLNAFTLGDRAYAHFYAGELEAAESDIRRVIELSPSIVDSYFLLGAILVAEHKAVDALSMIQSASDSLYRREGLALVYQALGRKAEADAALQDLLSKDYRDGPFQIAEVFATRGNNSAALDWLQRDYDLKMYGILNAKVDPLLRPLAREPRFVALMNKFAPSQ